MNILSEAAGIWSFAITLGIVGIIVVFIALALLVIILNQIAQATGFFTMLFKTKLKRQIFADAGKKRITAQESAAVSAAIYLYLEEIHDKESRVMTIRKVSKTYSPWSSKIYGLNILRK